MSSAKKVESVRAIKFLLFSISAGVVQILSFTLLNEALHLPYWVSYGISLVISVVWNFTLNRKFTFRSASSIPVAMLKTLAYYMVFTPLSLMLEYWLADKNGWNEYLVTAINMIINFVTEYLWQRLYVFRATVDTDIKAEEGNK